MAEPARPHKPRLSSKAEALRRRRERAMAGGGAEKEKAQRAAGKLTARERLDLLLDEGTFEELDLLVEKRCRDFGLDQKYLAADGVVAGFGRVNGRDVCVYSQDFTVMGGSLGLAHAHKICKAMDLALEAGVPVIGLCDSGGARIQEGVESLGGYAEIFYRNVQASGAIPQISAILGPCAGGAVYSPALTDFVYMIEGSSHMFITGPDVVRNATGETCDFESLGGAATHSVRSGVCHFVAGSEHDCFRQIRELLEYLPQNCREKPAAVMASDDPGRKSELLGRVAEMDARKSYKIHEVIWELADGHQFLEVHKRFARNLVVGFIRLGGESVGVVANNPSVLSGALDISASEKGARFVRFCDAFNIPLLTLVDVPGYWPGMEQEYNGIIRKGAKLLYAYCQATVPKVTVVLRKAYGGAYDVMSSKHIRGDLNYAWPCAEIAVMGPQGAVDILFRRELKAAGNQQRRRQELVDSYAKQFASPYQAAQRGYVDEVIPAEETRPKVVKAFRFLKNKKVVGVAKKHGNIPL
ncbi:MAG: acyl-CoA carboxylase subunit beta [Elusimicrobia bacterium]|nr:acyl-CoA carboxylase subunit beta [Elusimicrobiota bacterium]MDE2424734.1 acyl-CoA carboxylase subunit beta [Elusimicrobiota bacterium]